MPLLFMLVALAWISWVAWDTQKATAATELTDRLDLASEHLLRRMIDAETGMRGYAATHERLFLEPYELAGRDIPRIETVLRSSARDPAQVVRVAAISKRANLELLRIGAIIRRLDAGHRANVVAQILAGKRSMDEFRSEVDRLRAATRALRDERAAHLARDWRLLGYALAITFLAALATAAFSTRLFVRNVIARLAVVVRRTERIARSEEIGDPLAGIDAIAECDRAVYRMGVAIRSHAAELASVNESLVHRNKELQRLNSEMESFGTSVSHDLRNPVRVIDGFATILADEYGNVLDAEGHRLVSVIHGETRRMNDLIDGLLNLSRLGRRPLETSAIDMRELATETKDRHESLPPSGKRSIEIGALPAVNGDRVLLGQVWENLISNALKYSSTRDVARIEIDGAVEKGEAVFRVRDNGVGFDMKYYDQLFGIFRRLHNADEFPGTGVGLAVVQMVVTRHGGRVWACAAPGRGATFSFALPVG
ncbi:MAG TPA: ATP-binding protein [Candidatus Elarobacter sp.]|nr:ATP-binding protein [Candidatus Elarobacter sp.]